MQEDSPDRRMSALDGRWLAAADLGSNSFHLLIARVENGRARVRDRLKETVRLRSGLGDEGELVPEARARALACLEHFGQRLAGKDFLRVRAVGTDALRRAGDSQDFLEAARMALGYPVEVISGYEEARLIYAGATDERQAEPGLRLVLDIGGGSTEIILGEGHRSQQLHSLGTGSVSLSEACFSDGRIDAARFERALGMARGELAGVAGSYRQLGWVEALGASGTIRSIAELGEARGWSREGVRLHSLHALRDELLARGAARPQDFPELRPDRLPILPGGLAILLAAFECLSLEHMRLAPGALREGLLADMAAREAGQDVRAETVERMRRRHEVDSDHARAVAATADQAWLAVAGDWGLQAEPDSRAFLRWAAFLHELGLSISHARHHRHGAYVLRHADMAGFSREEQQLLATLVRLQRKLFSRRVVDALPVHRRQPALRLAALLRIAVLLHRERQTPTEVAFDAEGEHGLVLRLAEAWLGDHPALASALHEEVGQQKAVGIRLRLA